MNRKFYRFLKVFSTIAYLLGFVQIIAEGVKGDTPLTVMGLAILIVSGGTACLCQFLLNLNQEEGGQTA